MLDYNTIIETKNTKFFEHIYPLNEKISHASDIDNRVDKTHIKKVSKSKKQRKETSFGNDFFTYLINKDPVNYSEAISSSKFFVFRKEEIKVEIDSFIQN